VAGPNNPWLYRGAGALIALAVAAWLVFGGADSSDPSPAPSTDHSPAARRAPRAAEREAPPPEPAEAAPAAPAEPSAPPHAAFDPDELARVLYDGAVPAQVAAYDPEPTPAPAVADPTPSVPIGVPGSYRLHPDDPHETLRIARFWEGLLDARIEATEAALAAARESGNAAAERRARRSLERLRPHQPGLASRVRALQGEVEAADRATPAEP